MGLGGQDGCGRRIEVFVKNTKKKKNWGGGGVKGDWVGGCRVGEVRRWGGSGGVGVGVGLGGGQGGCERRIESFCKNSKKNLGGGEGDRGGGGGGSGWM